MSTTMGEPGSMPEGEAATRRHPSAGRWRTDLHAMAARVADQLRAAGVRYPGAAAAARAVRGATGLDQAAFADELDVDVELVAAIETGAVPVRGLPPGVLRAGPFLDWSLFEAGDGTVS